MKYFTLLFLLFSLTAFSQRKEKLIQKAEVKYRRGNPEKALKLLDKADQQEYQPSCANCAISFDIARHQLRSRIYMDREEYARARDYLDSIPQFISNGAYDSLKWSTVQLQIGEKALADQLDLQLESLSYTIDSIYFEDVIRVSFEADVHITLKTSFRTGLRYSYNKTNAKTRKEEWIATFKASILYQHLRYPQFH